MAAGVAGSATGGPTDAAPNPHISRDLCHQCHVGSTDPPVAAPAGNLDASCLACHDGRRAKSEPHPIGVAATGRGTRVPSDWPTDAGKLTCLTCHDVLPWCRGETAAAAARPNLLRPVPPAVDAHRSPRPGESASLAFCATCHDAGAFARFNPHRTHDAKGDLVLTGCGVCHEASFDAAAALPAGQRTGRSQLRAAETTLCGSCHSTHEDYFVPGHIGAKASANVLAALGRPNGAGDRTLMNLLPLQDGAVVTCSTCHNPHERGVFPSQADLAQGALPAASAPQGSILRLSRGELCIACHAH
jgi:hypothetical protein